MDDENQSKNWKLKLRYGKLKTPFQHFTLLADGVVGDLIEGFSCRPGRAIMGMKIWALSEEESFDVIRAIGEQIGFTVTGRVLLYQTAPDSPPRENPHAYGITFTPYDLEQDRPTLN
jgi:hypothetical protein